MDKLNKKILKLVNSASASKSWGDLTPILKEIQQNLRKNSTLSFDQLECKDILAKRLAQCLNPEFPGGLHELVLEVYGLILSNIMSTKHKLMDNLYLYSYGLFPFFTNASIKLKQKFLKNIISAIYLKLEKDELVLCLPGLLSALIPGLDDNDTETTKMIYQTFNSLINYNNGECQRDFFGVYWTLMLRCGHLRNSGIKFLLDKVKKYSELSELDEERKKEIIEKQFPNISDTIVNALCEIIKEKDNMIVRNGMDFIITRLPLEMENKMIPDEAKINLIISGLRLFQKNDESSIRRLNNWILGLTTPDDEMNFDSPDMKYKVGLIIRAFKIIFNPQENLNNKVLGEKILMLKRLFESQKELFNLILPGIAYDILKCIVNYWQNQLDCTDTIEKDESILQYKILFSSNDSCLDCLWNSLSEIIKASLKDENKDNIFQNFMKDISMPLKFCLLFIDMKTNQQKIKYYLPIVSSLLQIINTMPVMREGFKDIKQIAFIILAFLKNFQEINFNNNKTIVPKKPEVPIVTNTDFEVFDKRENDKGVPVLIKYKNVYTDNGNEDFQEIDYTNAYIIDEDASLEAISKDENNIQILNDFSNSINLFLEFYIKFLNVYSEIDNQKQLITRDEIFLLRQMADLNIRLVEYSQQTDDVTPLWLKNIEKIIFECQKKFKNTNLLLSIELSNIVCDLILSSTLKSPIYTNLKKNLLNEELDKNIIEEDKYSYIQKRINLKPNCYELLMAKFYILTNEQKHISLVMELLYKMFIIDNNKFNEIIYASLQKETNLIENIKLFSNFWKLINEYYTRKQFYIKPECIFLMVDLVDHKNPLLRHLSKSWLNQTNQNYNNILDPILIILINDEIKYHHNIQINTTEFTEEFDTSKILDGFNKLKKLFLNCHIIPFLMANNPSEEILNSIKFETYDKNMTYIQTLISISLHYIRTIFDKKNELFHKEVLSINATSCEFLEFLLNLIEDKQFIINNHELINTTMEKLLNFAFKEKDEVMPIQLLDILKVLYFNYPAEMINKTNNKKIIIGLLRNNKLIKLLTTGITNDVFYIRDHFISFSQELVKKYISLIKLEDKTELQNFYVTSSSIITPLAKFISDKLKLDIGKSDPEKFSHNDKDNNNIIYKNYCDEYKEYKTFDESEILSLLKGINDIIIYCFKNEILEQRGALGSDKNVNIFMIPIPFIKKKAIKVKTHTSYNSNWSLFKKELANSLKSSNPFLSFLTTFVIDVRDENPDSEISGMSSHLYENQILSLLSSFISIWVNQSDKYEPLDYCLNPKGILAYKKSDKYLSFVEIRFAKDKIANNPIKQKIIEISLKLFETDAIKFIENILDLWFSHCTVGQKISNIIYDKQSKLSIIELLISTEIPIDCVLFCVCVAYQNKTKDIANKLYKVKKDKQYSTNFNQSEFEASFFHFIYSYLLLIPMLEKIDINEIWKELLGILNYCLTSTKILYTYCWMYEVLTLSSERFPIRNVTTKEIKSGIDTLFSNLTNKLSDAIFKEVTECKYFNSELLVLPCLPQVYTNLTKFLFHEDNLYQKNIQINMNNNKNTKNEKSDNLTKNKTISLILEKRKSEGQIDLLKKNRALLDGKSTSPSVNNAVKRKSNLQPLHIIYNYYLSLIRYTLTVKAEGMSVQANELNNMYQLFAFVTLKENFYTLIKNIFDDNISTVKKYYFDIVNKLLGLRKKLINTKKNFYEPAKRQLINEFLVLLTQKSPENITISNKKDLMDYIKSQDFFNNVEEGELHGWKIIISQMAEYYPDILVDLFNDMQDKNIFVKKSANEKKNILRRISFVIYSCKKDKFGDNFKLIKSKAKDLLADYNENNELEGETFLLMRMLFLRFSHDGVMQMIRDLWPIIFTELIHNILNPEKNKSAPLLKESIKFVELLSLVNMEEFSLYQWIFLYDTFDINNLDKDKEGSLMKKLSSKNNKQNIFRPLLLELIMQKNYPIDPPKVIEEQKGKTQLYVVKGQDFKTSLIKLFYSVKDMSKYKVNADYDQIENTIEDDFRI